MIFYLQRHRNIPKRLRYYQGNIDLDLISKGEDYRKLTKSYIIFICTFDLFNKGRHKYTFETVCKEDNSIRLEDESCKIILNTKGIMKDLNYELIEFLDYVEHSDKETAEKSKGDFVKKVHRRVTEVKNDSSMEVEFMTLLERDREKIEEGIEKGRIQGLEEGRKEGIIEGEKKGKIEGIELAKKVFKLLNKGEAIENIARICEISEEKVREIIE